MNSLHEGNDEIDSMRIAVANNEMDVDGSAGGNTSDSDQEEYSVWKFSNECITLNNTTYNS